MKLRMQNIHNCRLTGDCSTERGWSRNESLLLNRPRKKASLIPCASTAAVFYQYCMWATLADNVWELLGRKCTLAFGSSFVSFSRAARAAWPIETTRQIVGLLQLTHIRVTDALPGGHRSHAVMTRERCYGCRYNWNLITLLISLLKNQFSEEKDRFRKRNVDIWMNKPVHLKGKSCSTLIDQR